VLGSEVRCSACSSVRARWVPSSRCGSSGDYCRDKINEALETPRVPEGAVAPAHHGRHVVYLLSKTRRVSHDPNMLPTDLPVPEDDGAAAIFRARRCRLLHLPRRTDTWCAWILCPKEPNGSSSTRIRAPAVLARTP